MSKDISPEKAEELKQLRVELADAETEVTGAKVNFGEAPPDADDKVASILQRIRSISGEQ